MLSVMVLAAALQTGPELVRGEAVLNCEVFRDGQLSHCRLVSETPSGRGFGMAAIRQFWTHRLPGRPPGRQDIPVVLRMTPDEALAAGITAPDSPPLVELHPIRFRGPPRAETERYAPPKSRRHAGAALQCTVQADGRLAQCRVLGADEPKYGEAALRAAEAVYRLPATDDTGRPTAGRPYNLEISFGRPGPPGPKAPCPPFMPRCGFGYDRTR